MRLTAGPAALAVCLAALAVPEPAAAQSYAIPWWTVDGGGAMSLSGGSYALSGTTGQPDAGNLSGGPYAISGGFWGGTLSTLSEADLAVGITGPTNPLGLTTVTYTVGTTNGGPSEATSVAVTQSFTTTPTTAPSFSSASGTGWSCVAGSSSVTCTRPSLASGSSAPNLGIQWTLGPAGGTLTAQAVVGASESDPFASNNTAFATTAVTGVPYADLAIAQTDGGVTALWNRPLSYAITVSNAGPNAVTGATVTDSFNTALSGVSWTCAASVGSWCTPSGTGSIADSAVNLAAGGSAAYTATGTVVAGTAGPIPNTASVSSPIHDPATGNNVSSLNTPVNTDLIFKDGFE